MGFSTDIDVKWGNLHTKKGGQKDLCGGKVSTYTCSGEMLM